MTDRSLQISTIPMSKLTGVLNDFIVKTVIHLDKISINVEEKLQYFDKKLNDLDVITSLIESKLNSLPPEITGSYPQLSQSNLDDVNPVVSVSTVIISPPQSQLPQSQPPQNIQPQQNVVNSNDNANANNNNLNQNANQEEEKKEEEKVEEVKKLTPEEELEAFMKEHDNETFRNLQKMLKLKIPEQALMQKAMMNGLNMDDVQKLAELWKKAHPY